MPDRSDQRVAELDRGLAETVSFFRSLSAEQLQIRIYQSGAQWIVQQVLAHFAVIERSMHRLFANIMAGGPGAPPDFDFERYNLTQTSKLDGLSLEELIDRFTALRRETIRIVKEMREENHDREGLHTFHGGASSSASSAGRTSTYGFTRETSEKIWVTLCAKGQLHGQ